jgi:hypothetical protein
MQPLHWQSTSTSTQTSARVDRLMSLHRRIVITNERNPWWFMLLVLIASSIYPTSPLHPREHDDDEQRGKHDRRDQVDVHETRLERIHRPRPARFAGDDKRSARIALAGMLTKRLATPAATPATSAFSRRVIVNVTGLAGKSDRVQRATCVGVRTRGYTPDSVVVCQSI